MTLPLAIFVVFTVGAAVMYLAQQVTFHRELRAWRTRVEVRRPMPVRRISVLKPLAGLDDELACNLESFAGQAEVDYEILFGVASMDDKALPIVRAFLERHPEVDARVILTDPHAALNPKAAQLVGLITHASGEIILVSDSNVRVHPHYLRRLVAALEEPNVGVVSNVVAGTGERTFGARMENLLLATHVAPGVVTGVHYTNGKLAVTVGKSIALRREALNAIGGFERVKDLMAEDFAIGTLAIEAGWIVKILPDLIENRNIMGTIQQTLRRHSRWAKTRRWSLPGGYVLEPLLVPGLWATGAVVVDHRPPVLVFAGLIALLHMVGAQLYVRALRGVTMPLWAWPLEILRVWIWTGCYVAGILSRHLEWRGHRLVVGPGGQLSAASEADAKALQAARARTVDVEDITDELLHGGPLRQRAPS